MSNKVTVKTSTPLSSNEGTIVLASIEGADHPDSAHLRELTMEERVRLAWDRFKHYEEALAHQRKKDAPRRAGKHSRSGLPPSAKRGLSAKFIADKVGLKTTSFVISQAVVETADFLRSQGRSQEADRLLHLLNNVSVNSAKKERDYLKATLVDRLIAQIQDEEAIQNEVNSQL